MITLPRRWDIFAKVVDNFGDAGVSWRLARQLAAEHGVDVVLWLDQLASLARIAPGVVTDRSVQRANGVTIRHWEDPFPAADPADVVVEAFGCGVPDAYVAAMAARASPPQWFVLEYLSAEPWVDDAHGLASPHPRLPLARRFWFPGFTSKTGGLLREHGVIAARDSLQADSVARSAWWAALGLPVPTADEIRISLFCYPNPMLPKLLDIWSAGDAPVACIVAEGVATGALDFWAGGAVRRAEGTPLVRGRLAVHTIPFIGQDDYDKLLWMCDVNFVRGEDSFVRAQWAARPFVWQLYPQTGRTHLVKLGAFIDRYVAGLDPTAAAAVQRLSGAWNGAPDAAPVEAAWLEFVAACPDLRTHGMRWATHLGGLPNLAAGLVDAARITV